MREFGEWLLSVAGTTGVIAAVAYLLRDTISKFLSKAVEHRFDQRLEKFRGELRDNEKELEQMRSFLASVRSSHNSALQTKRLEAAEILLRARNALAQLSMIVEYMKILNTEQMLKDAGDPKIAEFVEILARPFEIDNKMKTIGALDKTLPRLYLSDQCLKFFDAYEAILMNAIMMIKIFSIPLSEKGSFIKTGGLSKIVIDLVPGSKEGFDKWGESFAYQWSTYFHDQILRSLRHEVSGVDDLAKATEYVETLALNSRRAQLNVRSTLATTGLSENLIKKADENAAASSLVTAKLSA